MKNEETYIIVGKVGSSYGVQGWLRIHTYTEFGASILNYAPWFLGQNDEHWTQVAIADSRLHGNGLVVKIKGIDTPEEAKRLTGKFIAIIRSQLPKLAKDEYYWSDLEGLTVINKEGVVLGIVTHLMETGSNDVLVVKGEKEQAIPFLPERVILRVDLEKREIHVDWELL